MMLADLRANHPDPVARGASPFEQRPGLRLAYGYRTHAELRNDDSDAARQTRALAALPAAPVGYPYGRYIGAQFAPMIPPVRSTEALVRMGWDRDELRPPGLAGMEALDADTSMIGQTANYAVSAGTTIASGASSGQTSQAILLAAPQIAGAVVGGSAAAGAAWATAAIPIVGPIIAGVTLGLSFLFGRKGPKQKVATTQIVNAVEPYLQQNLQGYLNGPRTLATQKQALNNFDAGWQYVVEHCEIPDMGNPGKACVEDRQQGGKFDWFRLYRDPIANDPNVQPDAVPVTEYMGTGSGSILPLLAAGALVLVAFL